tara:strand:+ start:2826 stop:2954 length:129 start_codon:yes stop_codon:yes gene_type:complete
MLSRFLFWGNNVAKMYFSLLKTKVFAFKLAVSKISYGAYFIG